MVDHVNELGRKASEYDLCSGRILIKTLGWYDRFHLTRLQFLYCMRKPLQCIQNVCSDIKGQWTEIEDKRNSGTHCR